jgi:outer membrane protein assembly factor BamB
VSLLVAHLARRVVRASTLRVLPLPELEVLADDPRLRRVVLVGELVRLVRPVELLARRILVDLEARRLVEPVANGDTVVVAGRGRESVSVLYSDDGSPAYSVGTQDTHSITEAPTIADGVCYVPVDVESGEQTMGRLIAINLKDGKKEWDLDFSTPISTPALLKNGVYVSTVGGTLEWVDIQGTKRERIATVEGNISCPPTAAGSTVYCGGMNGFVYAVDTQTEEYIWKTALQEPIRASPAVDEQSVYAISMDGTVVRIDRQSGERAWKFETQPVVTARSISLVGDTVYVPTDWGAVGVDKRSGKEQWRWNGGNANHAAPAIANGTMYLTLTQGDIVGVS